MLDVEIVCREVSFHQQMLKHMERCWKLENQINMWISTFRLKETSLKKKVQIK